MAYERLNLANGITFNAGHVKHLEDGIAAAQAAAEAGVTDEQVETAVSAYLEENPVTSGATAEQAAQISANAEAIKALQGASSPIGYVESLDESNLVNLRDLESGSYVLYGYFKPYAGAPNTLTIDTQLINVVRKTAGSHILIFSTLNGMVNFLEIMVDSAAEKGFTYTRTDINLLELNALLQSGGSASRVADIVLLAASWVGDASPYSQVVAIDGITEHSQVDLTPSVEQLVIFYEKDLTLVAENDGGVVTVYAIGQKPENDYTIQVTITEVAL